MVTFKLKEKEDTDLICDLVSKSQEELLIWMPKKLICKPFLRSQGKWDMTEDGMVMEIYMAAKFCGEDIINMDINSEGLGIC